MLVLKVTLRGSKPPTWRRLEVPSSITLDELHLVIQAAFAWKGYHLHVFETADGRQYGDPDPELDFRSEYGVRLTRVTPVGAKLRYTYDFGDDWEHVVEVEKSLPPEPAEAYPRCRARHEDRVEEPGRPAGPLTPSRTPFPFRNATPPKKRSSEHDRWIRAQGLVARLATDW